MIRASLIFSFLLLLLPLKCLGNWELLYQPRQRTVKTIGIYNERIFIGTGNGVLLSNDNGKNWNDFGGSQLLKDSSGNSFINWISIDKKNEKIYIATSFGAYYSDVNKPDWQKLFESTKTESNDINSVTINNPDTLISTNDGFWICNLNENQCDRLNQGLEPDNITGSLETFYSLKHENALYLATSNGIYILDDKKSTWEKISNGIQSLPNGRINAKHLYTDKENNFWAACGTGIYKSQDKGKIWIKSSNGISANAEGFQETFYLYEINGLLFAATTSGIYSLDEKKNWLNLSNGIRTKESNKNVYWISGLKDSLFAATDEGLFVASGSSLVAHNLSHESQATSHKSRVTSHEFVLKGKVETDYANLEELEPSVIEVQKQALKFASLPTTNDYKRYRTQARLRNLIPRVGFDINTTGTSTDFYQFNKGLSTDISLNNQFDAGRTTRLERDGKSFKQLSILWNTNQFVYDDEIREILNQARLTANIKENLLDDATRIYYQRRRLQLDGLFHPSNSIEQKLDKDLEIAHLTGQIDSRTGGWFTKEIEKRKWLRGEE